MNRALSVPIAFEVSVTLPPPNTLISREFREHPAFKTTPIVFLSGENDPDARFDAINAGGDDFLTKPFALAELIVRVRALLKRREASSAPASGLRLDPGRHGVTAGERTEALTPTEFRLLAALLARPGTVVRRGELVAAAWPDGAVVNANTLDAYVGRLRRKLRALEVGERIETARGVGYVLR